MITGSDDYLIKVWCTRTGYLINTFKGHQDVITDIALNVENTLLASASSDGSVRIWNIKTGEPRAVLVANPHGRSKSITAVKFSPSPVREIRFLATTCDDGLCRLYRWSHESLTFSTEPITIDGRPDARDTVTSFAFNHTGSRLAIATKSGYVSIYSTIAGAVSAPADANWGEPKLIKRLAAHEESITTLTFSGDGEMLLTGATDGTAKVWKCNSADLRWDSVTIDIKEPAPAPGEAPELALSNAAADVPRAAPAPAPQQQQQSLSSGQGDAPAQGAAAPPATQAQQQQGGTLPRVSEGSGIEAQLPSQHPAAVAPVAAAPSQQEIQATQQAAAVAQPPAALPELPATAAPADADISMAAAGPVELVSDSTAPMPAATLAAPAAATPGGDAGTPATLAVKRVETNQVAWVCDSSRILISNNLGTVFVADPRTGSICWRHRAHSVAEIYVLIPHPSDPRIAVSGGYDGRALIWNVEAGSVIREFRVGEQLFDGSFSEDGLSFAVASESGAATLFGLGPAWAYDDANKMPEQMFANDYTATIMDENHFVADQQTQIASYLVPHSALMDFDGRVYRRQKGSRFGLGIEMGVDNLRFEQEDAGRCAALQIELAHADLDDRAAQDPIAETRPVRRRRRRGRPTRSETVEEIPEPDLQVILPVDDDSDDEEYTAGEEEEEEEEEEEDEDMMELARGEGDEANGEGDNASGHATSAWDRRSALELLRSRHNRSGSRSSRPGPRRGGRRTIDEDEDDEDEIDVDADGGAEDSSTDGISRSNGYGGDERGSQYHETDGQEGGFESTVGSRVHRSSGRRGQTRSQAPVEELATSDDDFAPNRSRTSLRSRLPRRQSRRRGGLQAAEPTIARGEGRPHTRNRRITSDSEDEGSATSADAGMDVDIDGESNTDSVASAGMRRNTRARRSRGDDTGPSSGSGQTLRLHLRSLRTTSRRSSGYNAADTLDADEMGGAMEDHLPAVMRGDSQNIQPRAPVPVGMADTSEDSFASDGVSRPRWSRRQTQRKQRSLKPNGRGSGAAGLDRTAANAATASTSRRIDQVYEPTDWVLATTPGTVPYRPQVGDVIAYFREGHQDFWSSERRCKKLSEKLLPYITTPNLPVVVFGQVVSISYAVGPPTYCTVKVQLLRHQTIDELDSEDTISPELNRRYIQVQYHDCDGVPDFLILYSRYRASLRRPLSCGDSVSVLFDEDQMHKAVISGFRGIKPSSRQSSVTRLIARNPWKSIVVEWVGADGDNDSAMESGTDAESKTEQVSPWELAHDDVCMDAEISEDTKEALLEIVGGLRASDEFAWFVKNVDYEAEYPDYLLNIAYPMCLDTIYERLGSSFYRHISAVMFDMALIQENADTFNDPGTPVPIAAQRLIARYRQLLDQALGSKKTPDSEDAEDGLPAPAPLPSPTRQSTRLRRTSTNRQPEHAEPRPSARARKRKTRSTSRSGRRASRRRIDNVSDESDYMDPIDVDGEVGHSDAQFDGMHGSSSGDDYSSSNSNSNGDDDDDNDAYV
ncbi:hypothetical protein GQ54DRAFT_296189 [Martensiomyces pterosporus]|nr:hypothetical protein GQ54DRAFT_296189 [Martensiomyces pterosporus]